MSVRSYIIDDREKKRFLLDREVLVSEDVLRTEMAQHLRPLLDLCRARLRAEEAGRFPLAQGCRPAGDLLPRSGGQRSTACSTPAATAAPSSAPSARAIGGASMCIYHGWTYGNDGSLVGVPGDDAYAESFDKSSHGLRRPARFEEYRGFWFMNLDEDADRASRLSRRRQGLHRSRHRPVAVGPDGDHRRRAGVRRRRQLEADGREQRRRLSPAVDAFDLAQLHGQFGREDRAAARRRGWCCRRRGKAVELGNGHFTTDNVNFRGRPVAKWIPLYGEAAKAGDRRRSAPSWSQRLGPGARCAASPTPTATW